MNNINILKILRQQHLKL